MKKRLSPTKTNQSKRTVRVNSKPCGMPPSVQMHACIDACGLAAPRRESTLDRGPSVEARPWGASFAAIDGKRHGARHKRTYTHSRTPDARKGGLQAVARAASEGRRCGVVHVASLGLVQGHAGAWPHLPERPNPTESQRVAREGEARGGGLTRARRSGAWARLAVAVADAAHMTRT